MLTTCPEPLNEVKGNGTFFPYFFLLTVHKFLIFNLFLARCYFYSSVGGTNSAKTVNCLPPQKGQHYYLFFSDKYVSEVIDISSLYPFHVKDLGPKASLFAEFKGSMQEPLGNHCI